MQEVTYNFRLDKSLRDKAFSVIRGFGMTPSQALRMFLTQTAETNQMPLSFNYDKKFNSATLESIEEINNNLGNTYENFDDFLKAKNNEN